MAVESGGGSGRRDPDAIDPDEPARDPNPKNWTKPQIRRLQRRLKKDGYYDGEIDGIFGSQSRKAWRQWERNDKTPAFANEPATGIDPNAVAIEPDAGKANAGAEGGAGEATGGGKKGLRGVPGGGKLWKVGDDFFLIYTTPRLGGGEPLQLAWKIRDDEELKAITGKKKPKVDRTVKGPKALDRQGIVRAGRANELANLGKHPMDALKDTYRKEVQIRPWLKDPEMLNLTVEAHLEGRAVTDAELKTTEWWTSRTPAERQWAQFVAENGGAGSDAVQQAVNDKRLDVERRMIDAGLNLPGRAGKRVLDYLTREYVTGRLTEDALQTTIEQEANPYRTGHTKTAGFDQLPPGSELVRHGGRVYLRTEDGDFAFAKGLESAKYGAGAKKVDAVDRKGAARDIIAKSGTPQGRGAVQGLERVRGLIREWIGPQLMDGWSEAEIARWAQRIVENPQAENELVTKLRATRAARYTGYDAELTYDDIARIGRAQVLDTWGQQIDEKDPLFQQILQMNDAGQASQLLWEEGLKRGVRKVTYDAMSGLERGLGGQVIRSVV